MLQNSCRCSNSLSEIRVVTCFIVVRLLSICYSDDNTSRMSIAMATKRVTFRLYPSKIQANRMHYWRRLHKDLYNACVEHRKTSYKKFNRSVDYFDQQNCLPEFKEYWEEYKELGSHALQDTVKRVDFAFKRFFKLKSGYPKFKSSRYYKGWTYPCASGWKAHLTRRP